MLEWIIGFFIYYFIGFFYILFVLKSEEKFDGYLLGIIAVACFWPFVLLMGVLGYIRIAFQALIQRRTHK